MGIERFDFTAPGSEFVETDNTMLPNSGSGAGPLVLGRSERGPLMIPITVQSAEQFVDVFGYPISGTKGGDVWRSGFTQAPTFGVYAAMAWLKNRTPFTFVRLGGVEHPERVDNAGEAGWSTSLLTYTDNSGAPASQSTNGGCYGLFVADKYPSKAGSVTYVPFGAPGLSDLTIEGKYTGSHAGITPNVIIEALIAAPGAPDNFRFSVNGGAFSPSTAMTGRRQALSDGFYVTFGAITGHTIGDTWSFGVTSYDELTLAAKFYVDNGALALEGTGISTLPGPITSAAPGLDDMTVSAGSEYVGPGLPMYRVRISIDGGLLADSFEWSDDNGTNWYGPITCLAGVAQPLNYGISVQFVADTGHALNDSWRFTIQAGSAQSTAAACLVASTGSDCEFRMKVYDNTWSSPIGVEVPTNQLSTVRFNFNPASINYIRKVFNSNATLTNTEITDTDALTSYWLGESFDQSVTTKLEQPTGAGNQFACLLKMEASGGASIVGQAANCRTPFIPCHTGWVIGQDLSDDFTQYDPNLMPKLFKFHSLNDGEWTQKNLKISINNIRYSSSSSDFYGRFDIEVRKASDSDKRTSIVERFTNCSLNPDDERYVGKMVGTRYLVFDEVSKTYTSRGKYKNRSKYIRVELSRNVDTATANPELLPFGFYGPTAFADIPLAEGTIVFTGDNWVRGGNAASQSLPFVTSAGLDELDVGSVAVFKATLTDAINKLRKNSTEESITLARQAYWGVSTSKVGTFKYDGSYEDINRFKSNMIIEKDGSDVGCKFSFIFSLDDVRYETSSLGVTNTANGTYDFRRYIGRTSGQSISAGEATDSGGISLGRTPSYRHVIDSNMARFTMALWGGFDGLDIKEKEPFRNERLLENISDPTRNYAIYSINRILDTLQDKNLVQFNKILIPGVTVQSINNSLIALCEDRQDALAMLDIGGQYQWEFENNLPEEDRMGSVDQTVSELLSYDYNTSFGYAAFNPVQIIDRFNKNNAVWIPAVVAALDVMGMSFKVSGYDWFSPAGYTRGNLNTKGQNAQPGLTYTGVMFMPDETQRKALAQTNLNPFLSLPEGIQLMDVKTLLFAVSKMQLVGNRLAILKIKEELKTISDRVLFDPNLQITWNRFKDPAEKYLSSVRTNFGIVDSLVVMDETTNTKDVVDRNVIYGKIFIQLPGVARNVGIEMVMTEDSAVFTESAGN